MRKREKLDHLIRDLIYEEAKEMLETECHIWLNPKNGMIESSIDMGLKETRSIFEIAEHAWDEQMDVSGDFARMHVKALDKCVGRLLRESCEIDEYNNAVDKIRRSLKKMLKRLDAK